MLASEGSAISNSLFPTAESKVLHETGHYGKEMVTTLLSNISIFASCFSVGSYSLQNNCINATISIMFYQIQRKNGTHTMPKLLSFKIQVVRKMLEML